MVHTQTPSRLPIATRCRSRFTATRCTYTRVAGTPVPECILNLQQASHVLVHHARERVTRLVEVNRRYARAFYLDMFDLLVIISPTDPALDGETANVTVSLRVTAWSDVAGDRAMASWNLNLILLSGFPFQKIVVGHRSTVPDQNSGDLSCATYTVTGSVRLGSPASLQVTFGADVSIACATGEPCPPPSLTGMGHIDATFQWLDITDVRDQAGHPVPFTVCSASGTNWLGMP